MDAYDIVFAIFAGSLLGVFMHTLGCDWRRGTLLLVVAFAIAAIAVALSRATGGQDPFHNGAAFGSWAMRLVLVVSAWLTMRWLER